jgi:phosphohistidine phosphatase
MKKITLIRHAKSCWNNLNTDLERPISDEGIKKSIKVASFTKKSISEDAIIWVSNAQRTTQTAKLFLEIWELNHKKEPLFRNDLYTFDGFELEKVIKSCPNVYQNLILFGHNSAITDFVNKFGDIFIDNVPTSGFVSIVFETNDWNTISKGKTDKMIFPRDI